MKARMARLVTPSDYAEFFSLESVFITALLLIGDVARAEGAVLNAINKVDFETPKRQALLEQVARDAVAIFANDCSTPAAITLDPHLSRVMELPMRLRHCFVLRILVRLDLQQCAEMLRIEPVMVDALAVEASCKLAMTYQA
jgi:hypothetical protein